MNGSASPPSVDCVTVGSSPRQSVLGRKQWLIAGAAGFMAMIWLTVLSGWLGVTSGAVITKRRNVLFDSDMNVWLDRMIGNDTSLEYSVHPLEIMLWRGPCRAVASVAKHFVPPNEADVLGPRIVVAFIAGVGVAFLALLAIYAGVQPLQGGLLFVIYLLFTSNTTICLPEHFGISNGFLTLSLAAMVLVTHERLKLMFLGLFAVVLGGTSVLNALFPLACMFDTYFKSIRVKIRLLLAGAAVTVAGVAGFRHFSASIHAFLTSHAPRVEASFNNFVWFYQAFAYYRLIHHPLTAMVYAVFMLIQPAVGPHPNVLRYPGNDMVSYEPGRKPFELSYYLAPQGIGAVAWVILLSVCVYYAWQDERMRPYVRLLLGWVAFNIVFYNIWGREMLLWAPHWSWALMALVVLGARRVSWKFTAAVFVPIAASQILTLFQIKNVLLTITR